MPEQLALFDSTAPDAPEPLRLGATEIFVGTSGYAFPDWRGRFYPNDLPRARELAWYARRFPAVELNFTHYRPPEPQTLAKMRDQTPPNFRFAVKLHRALTHEWAALAPAELAAAARGFGAALAPLREGGRLLAVLAQFPASFRDSPAARAHLARLRELLPDDPLAVEFRHCDWGEGDAREALARAGLSWCAVDAPELPELPGRECLVTGNLAYVRLHSRDAAKWYAGGAARYDYLYSDAELGEWAAALAAAIKAQTAQKIKRAAVFFNNCARGQAAANAGRFMELMRGTG